MDFRISWGLIGLLLVAILALFAIKLAPSLHYNSERYLAYDNIQGVEVIHNATPYTLNFEQQNKLITLLNRSMAISRQAISSPTPLPVSAITIYRFKRLPVEAKLLAYEDDSLLFESHQWNSDGDMRAPDGAKLHNLLAGTFDN